MRNLYKCLKQGLGREGEFLYRMKHASTTHCFNFAQSDRRKIR